MKIKKLITLLLTLLLTLMFVGCKSTNDNTNVDSTPNKTSSKTTSNVNNQTSSSQKLETTSSKKDNSTTTSEQSSSASGTSSTTSEENEGTKLEDDSILYHESKPASDAKIEFKNEYEDVLLTSADVAKISALFISGEGYAIQFDFTEEGKEKFKTITEQYLGCYLFLFVNDEQLLAPMINTVITDGKTVVINPEISKEELFELYNSLT